MKFTELDKVAEEYNLSDAVALHHELNPKIFSNNEMRSEVRTALLNIAEDFISFIGIDSLDVEDIVVIGSNVAYSYTPHSDLDLHIVVDIDKLGVGKVYRELFDSKKNQYNDQHDIKIRGITVELYVQDAAQPPVSLGMYSVKNNEWIQAPKRQPFKVNDSATKTKYSQLKNQSMRAIASKNKNKIQNALDSIGRARKSGLASQGEFSPENIAYKILRTQGIVQSLRTALTRTKDVELSVEGAQVIDETALMEINMSPGNLAQLAKSINAKAGMEFEMYVPNAGAGSDESELEPDYSEDSPTYDIRNIIEFFTNSEYNSGGEIRRLRDKMNEEFYEWKHEQIANLWDDEGRDYFFERMEDEDKSEEEAEEEWDNRGREYDRAYDQFQEEKDSDYSEGDWLNDVGMQSMSDIERSYDLVWPYYTSTTESGDLSINDVAEDFADAIGRNVNSSDKYHGGERDATSYVVEPDSSLDEMDNETDGGLEFISPPLPISDMLSDLRKVRRWAQSKGCYTNSSTGLHINVSVDGVDAQSLDFVKLALLLGDKYVLEQFGRTGNSFCTSAISKISQNISELTPDQVASAMDQMKNGLANLASKAVHSGQTKKYISINNKNGYIEFRSPGGDWLNEPFEKVESTLLRMVVALDAACDPDKYRQEYLKKLYQILTPANENDPLAYFAKYAAGTIPRAALKSFVRQAQLKRKTASQQAAQQDMAKQARAQQQSQLRWAVMAGDEKVFELNAPSLEQADRMADAWLNARSSQFLRAYQGQSIKVVEI